MVTNQHRIKQYPKHKNKESVCWVWFNYLVSTGKLLGYRQLQKPKIYTQKQSAPGKGWELSTHDFQCMMSNCFYSVLLTQQCLGSMLRQLKKPTTVKFYLSYLLSFILYSLSTWPFLQTFCFHRRGNHLSHDYVQCKLHCITVINKT